MADSMDFEREPLLQPLLDLRIGRRNRSGHDRNRSASVDLLQPGEDWAQEGFVFGGLGHVIDRQNHTSVDARFADPLRRSQFRKMNPNIKRVRTVQVGQEIAVRCLKAFVEISRPSDAPCQGPHKKKRSSFARSWGKSHCTKIIEPREGDQLDSRDERKIKQLVILDSKMPTTISPAEVVVRVATPGPTSGLKRVFVYERHDEIEHQTQTRSASVVEDNRLLLAGAGCRGG